MPDSSALALVNLRVPRVPFDIEAPGYTCSICLRRLTERVTTVCNHHFHRGCLETWLQSNLSCPVCQRDFSAFVERRVVRQEGFSWPVMICTALGAGALAGGCMYVILIFSLNH